MYLYSRDFYSVTNRIVSVLYLFIKLDWYIYIYVNVSGSMPKNELPRVNLPEKADAKLFVINDWTGSQSSVNLLGCQS